MEILVGDLGHPIEYVCHGCKQLRLALLKEPPTVCGNCGSKDIETGEPGTLERPT